LKTIYSKPIKRWISISAVVSASLVLGSCSVNPATGKQQLNFFSEAQEIQMGQEFDRQVVAEMGLYDDPELQRYVDELGQRLARQSERPDLPWTFRVVDDPAVNAFAVPGGFIYLTRGILAHMTSEAEMVGVLGHEIGHVTAQHSVNQISKQQLAGVGLGLGMALSEDVAQFGDVLQTGMGLLFLNFSRADERQADDLGFRYVSRVGYPPAAMAELFTTLERVGESAGAGRLPNWLSTHPNPGNRREAILARVPELPPELRDAPWRARPFLERIDGITFGPNPREGFFRGDTFYHPDLAFQLDFPPEWKRQNTRQAVVAQSPRQDAIVVMTLAEEDSPRSAAQEFFQQAGVEPGNTWRTSARGFDTVAREFYVSDGTNELRGGVAFLAHGGEVFQILGYSRADAWRGYERTLGQTVASFARLRDRELLDVEPMRVELVRLPRDMTLEEFARRYPSSVDLDTLGVINHVRPGEVLRGGSLAKRVVGFNPEQG